MLLIHAQRPDATQVAGYGRWLELGRRVRRGERGLLILAPVFRSRGDDDDDADDDRRPVSYRAAYVFHVSQTEPLPRKANVAPIRPMLRVPPPTGQDGSELYSVLLTVAESDGVTVAHESPVPFAAIAQEPECTGFYVPQLRAIWARPNAPLQMVGTLGHELAHHFGCHDESNPNNEAMAEGAAYVVLQAFGLDSAERSVPYIAGWDARKPGAYKSALAGIQRTARIIIERTSEAAGQPPGLALAA